MPKKLPPFTGRLSSGLAKSAWPAEDGPPELWLMSPCAKPQGFAPLREAAGTSRMRLFLFGPVPAQAFRASPSEAARRIR